jgi:hypothetical protein
MSEHGEMRIDSFRVHFCRENGNRAFVGYVEAGDAKFVFWGARQLFEILQLQVGSEMSLQMLIPEDRPTGEAPIGTILVGKTWPGAPVH